MSEPSIACIRLPALALQLAAREAPDDASPLAVVGDERPDAKLLLVNRAAHHARLAPGMRQSTARQLMPTLRVCVITESARDAAMEELVALMQTLSPFVERDAANTGVLYVDPTGLEHVHGGIEGFADAVQRALTARGLRPAIVFAFDRHTSFVLACSLGVGMFIATSAEEALERAKATKLVCLGFSTDLLRTLARLGIGSVGELIALPVDTVHARLGAEASTFVRAFTGTAQIPLQPRAFVAPIERAFDIEPPEADAERLVFVTKMALTEVARDVAARGVSIVALAITLSLDHGPIVETRIEPATATLDAGLLGELWRLRLSALTLSDPVAHMRIFAETTASTREQLALFRSKRDLKAASRALARVRAAFGEQSVVRASLRDAHLPEASFTFEPTLEVRVPAPRRVPEAPLMRRMLRTPQLIDPAAERMALGERAFSLSGGWRVRDVLRDYYYAQTPEGALLLVYFDHARGRYFKHGEVD